MPNLSYSDDALNVLSDFYGVSHMLFVEGDDDVVFWEMILDIFDVRGFKVKAVDGKEEVEKYIAKIEGGLLDSWIAKDSDYSMIAGNSASDKVLVTYGHSIENSILNIKSVFKAIRSLGRVSISQVKEKDIKEWLDEFLDSFDKLIVADVVNDINGLGVRILGNNCTRFMTSEKSHNPCIRKIEGQLSGPVRATVEPHMDEVRTAIRKSGREIHDVVRGHFLFSAYLKYVNYRIKSAGSFKKASNDAFFSTCVVVFDQSVDRKSNHFLHYKREVEKLLSDA